MRDSLHNFRRRPGALALSWAVVGLVALWPGTGAKPNTGLVVESAHLDPAAILSIAGDSAGAVGPDLNFGYEAAALAASDTSRPGPQMLDADGIRKRIPRRYRLSFPGAVPDCQLLARAMRFQAALQLLPAELPHDGLLRGPAIPRAPPQPASA